MGFEPGFITVVPVAQTFGNVCETKPYDIQNILRLVTVTVEEDRINIPICSPGAFIRQHNQKQCEAQFLRKQFLLCAGFPGPSVSLSWMTLFTLAKFKFIET